MAPPRGIHAIATTEPERVALITEDGQRTTYSELDAAASRLAHVLADLGASPGARVAVCVANRPEVFVAWNAAARLGCLVVPISARAAPAEVRYLVEDSGAVVLVHDGSDGAHRSGVAVPTVAVDDPRLASAPEEPPLVDYVASPVMWMHYTSGTTGRPKGIERPPPPPATTAPPQPFMDFWSFGRDDVHLLCGPASHTAPGAYAQMHLVEGATVVIMSRFDARRCLELIATHRVTNSHMVPANFVRILELPAEVRAAYDLSSVRRILHGAAPCPPEVKRRIMEVFPPGTVWEYYGASEGMGTVISPEEWLAHPGSVGRAFPGLEIRILDDDGRELGPRTIGTVYLRPVPGWEPRYHNDPDATARAWRGELFTVGDLGYLDEDGYLYLVDRRSDLIIRGGANIYPAEVEAALHTHPDVVDAAVIGLPDPVLGQRVHAIVELRPGATVDGAGLAAALRDLLAPYKIPESWEFVAELPRDPNGKVSRRRLVEERTGQRGG